MNDSIMQDKVIVGYLDILGYTDIIEAHYENLGLIRNLESLMVGATSGLMVKARERLFPGTKYETYSKQIIELITQLSGLDLIDNKAVL